MGIGGQGSTTGKKASAKEHTAFSGTTRERMEVSDEAVDKIIADVLGGANGLASIFSGEQTTGIYNSSVANQAAGDLAANLAGEIAKLRAERVVTEDTEEDRLSRSKERDTAYGVQGQYGVLS